MTHTHIYWQLCKFMEVTYHARQPCRSIFIHCRSSPKVFIWQRINSNIPARREVSAVTCLHAPNIYSSKLEELQWSVQESRDYKLGGYSCYLVCKSELVPSSKKANTLIWQNKIGLGPFLTQFTKNCNNDQCVFLNSLLYRDNYFICKDKRKVDESQPIIISNKECFTKINASQMHSFDPFILFYQMEIILSKQPITGNNSWTNTPGCQISSDFICPLLQEHAATYYELQHS